MIGSLYVFPRAGWCTFFVPILRHLSQACETRSFPILWQALSCQLHRAYLARVLDLACNCLRLNSLPSKAVPDMDTSITFQGRRRFLKSGTAIERHRRSVRAEGTSEEGEHEIPPLLRGFGGSPPRKFLNLRCLYKRF